MREGAGREGGREGERGSERRGLEGKGERDLVWGGGTHREQYLVEILYGPLKPSILDCLTRKTHINIESKDCREMERPATRKSYPNS